MPTIGDVLVAIGKLPRPIPVKTWNGTPPTTCDICHNPIKKEFVDGLTQYGPWGIMCKPCHKRRGCGLGTGRGQKYVRDSESNRWVKVEG